MAAGYSGVNLELQHTDTYPLLMDHHALGSEHGHVTSIMPDTSESLDEYKGSRPANLPSSPRENIVISIDVPSISPASTPSQEHMNLPATSSLGRSISASSHSQLIPAASSSRRSRSSGRHTDTNGYSTQQRRTNPLNSGLWISIDMVITVGQIIASIIVLSLSRDENPHAPLALWVMGYAAGCLAMLPLLYWRYTHRHARQLDHDSLASSAASSSSAPSSPHTAHPLSQHTSQQGEELEGVLPAAGGRQVPNGGDSRYLEMITVHMERFKIALDCFFAVWFVVGNVWIFGGHSSSHEAPNLYRLCIVFLMFSCISYAMPFVICATVCCCLPCIITLLSYREDHAQAKGAAPEVIAGLPIYKFKTTDSSGKGCKDGNDSDCENPGEGGIFAPGTDKERVVSGEDAVCCICLGKYKDGMDLKELQCAHFFHVECVDKWLKINATCPLCKHELGDSGGDDQREQLMT